MKWFFVFLLASLPLAAQPFSFGAKIGVPLTEAFNNDGGKFSFSHSTGRYIIGPTAEIRLPFIGLGVEADALFRRFNIGGDVNEFEFQILVKYRFPGLLIHPFVDAGPTFNYVSDPGLFGVRLHESTAGVAIGGGLEVKALLIRLSPELRYTHWRNTNINLAPVNGGISSKQDQLEFIVGITF
jgi:hypothetical protein